MDDAVFEEVGIDPELEPGESEFRGRDFGSRVHDFAEAYALGEDVEPTTRDHPDEGHVKTFIDGLEGELHIEEQAVLPLTVDGEQVMLSGIVDLVHVTDDVVEIVDYKTDQTDRAESEYRKQLSVYYHVLEDNYPEREVSASIFYTAIGERRRVEPLSKADLAGMISTRHCD